MSVYSVLEDISDVAAPHNSSCSDIIDHGSLMDLALQQAEIALTSSEVPVGCVFVDSEGEVIAAGHNETNMALNGTRHAELVAFNRAVYEKGISPERFIGSILYVTCEPCIMCAAALSKLKIKEVYFGCCNDRFGGNGSILSVHNDVSLVGDKYEIHAGLRKDEAIAVFQRFYESENRRAPDAKRRKKGG